MSRKLLLGLLAGVLASVGAYASDELSYSYVGIEYVRAELDDGPEGDGLGVTGSAEIGSAVHVFASYGKLDFDPYFGLDVEGTTWSGGIGYHRAIAERASFFADVSYVDVELDTNFGDASDDGYSVGIGVRGLVATKVELHGGISYVDLSDSGDDTSFGGGVRFNFTEMVSLGARYTTSDDSDSVAVALRLYWGK